MKKALFLFMLTLPLLAIAQNKVKFGINAGAVLSDVRGESYAADFNYGMGYLFGVSMETRLSERLSFIANINYERKNPTKKEDYSYMIIVAGQNGMAQEIMIDGTAKITTILDYISIPVNLKYYIGTNKDYFVTTGLFAAFMADERVKVKHGTYLANYHNNYHTLDYGVNLGIGKKIKLSDTQNLNMELRDNFGLSTIAHDFKAKTNSINLIANWQFDL